MYNNTHIYVHVYIPWSVFILFCSYMYYYYRWAGRVVNGHASSALLADYYVYILVHTSSALLADYMCTYMYIHTYMNKLNSRFVQILSEP